MHWLREYWYVAKKKTCAIFQFDLRSIFFALTAYIRVQYNAVRWEVGTNVTSEKNVNIRIAAHASFMFYVDICVVR